MYKKYLIISSKQDKAGTNIALALAQYKIPNVDFYEISTEIIDIWGIDKNKVNSYDFVIFASKHQSEKGGKTLSVHAPGNFKKAELGGETGKLCKTSAVFEKQLFQNLFKQAKEDDLKDYSVTLECTHHGPLIEKPCLFIEIGATPVEWRDKRAAFIVAKAIKNTIETFKENPYNEIAIGIGGPHYCPNFNKIQLESNIAISHIIPQYIMPLTEENIIEAIDKTQEEVDFVLLDWKGIGPAEQRNIILEILSKNYISYKKLNEIK